LTIHYHGTPVTPREVLYTLAGKHFCCSLAEPRDADVCAQIGQSVLYDNGAFTAHQQGKPIDEAALYSWLERRLVHPHRAVVLDRIGGDVEEQRAMVKRWPLPRELSWPVWHLDKPLDYLLELADTWPGVCLGSAGAFWNVGAPVWRERMVDVFEFLARRRAVMPHLHGLRMLGQCDDIWPLASADSVNVARNHAGSNKAPKKDAKRMAERIDSVQCPPRWYPPAQQLEFVA
jgi:hypothetical protein